MSDEAYRSEVHWAWLTLALIVAISSTGLAFPSFIMAFVVMLGDRPPTHLLGRAEILALAWPVLLFVSAMAGFVAFASRSRRLTVFALIPVVISVMIFAGVTLQR